MIIDNETLNCLIRHGDGYKTFSSSPRITTLLDSDGNFEQSGDQIPFMDGLRSLVHVARSLCPNLVHPGDLVSLSFARSEFESLIISLLRHLPIQPNMFTPQNEPINLINTEVGFAIDAHAIVCEILAAVEKHENDKRILPMETYLKVLSKSKNTDLALKLIGVAGPENPSWTSSDGPLPAITRAMPETLPAKKAISIIGKLTDVNRRTGFAKLEIETLDGEYAKSVLRFRPSDVELEFDTESTQLNDLLLFYYLNLSISINVTATCAVHPKYARKTSLLLSKIRASRSQLDKLHATAKQFELPFDRDAKS